MVEMKEIEIPGVVVLDAHSDMPKQCVGCEHNTGTFCNVLDHPWDQHTRIEGCHMRTHNRTITGDGTKKFIDPMRASRQAAKARVKESKKLTGAKAKKKKERRDIR